MKLISHRGYVSGKDDTLENNPIHVFRLCESFDVEVDLRIVDDKLFLGHDTPRYEVSVSDLLYYRNKLWIHIKDINTLKIMLQNGWYKIFNCFFHEEEDFVLTSEGYLWCYPNKDIITSKSVLLQFDDLPLNQACYAVCTDYIV